VPQQHQSVFVPPFVVAMSQVWPGDDPVELLERESPLNPILDSPGGLRRPHGGR
jgi:hypothetical protein